MKKLFYRQKLPHKQADHAIYFVTYRLYGSIPVAVIQQLQSAYELSLKKLLSKQEYTSANEYALQKKYFAQFDAYLDAGLNEPYWLKQNAIAQMVYDSLLHLAGSVIHLYCFTIMSNHVHTLFSVNDNNTDLYKILQSHKSFTAKNCNGILQRTGAFWEPESYDHIVRPGEFDKIVNYILQNPVEAGLVKNWEDWKWNFLQGNSAHRICK
jgi:REP element-mobilizing transposase RayT